MANNPNNNIKNDISSGACIILLLVFSTIAIIMITSLYIAILSIPLVVPALFIYWLLKVGYKYYKQDSWSIKNRFKLTENEKGTYLSLCRDINFAYGKKAEIDSIIENEHIPINADGNISRRSYRGQEVRGALENANKILNKSVPTYNYLKDLPKVRWTASRKHYSKIVGLACGLIVWVVIIGSAPKPISNLSRYIYGIENTASSGASVLSEIWSFSKDKTHKETSRIKHKEDKSSKRKSHNNDGFIIILCKALLYMCITFVITWGIAKIVFRVKFTKPDEVTVEKLLD